MVETLNTIEAALKSAVAPCVTSSFQAECVVLVHMLHEVHPTIPVLFIDTYHHFAETYAYRDEIVSRWSLNLINVGAPDPKRGAWESSTDECCRRHKVGPLFESLEHYDTWFTALRREQSPSRAQLSNVAPFQLPSGKSISKISPLASWTAHDVEAYALVHEIPLLPLYARGYTSIGCEPCTRLPFDPNNARSGRWNGQKLECGIHIEAKDS